MKKSIQKNLSCTEIAKATKTLQLFLEDCEQFGVVLPPRLLIDLIQAFPSPLSHQTFCKNTIPGEGHTVCKNPPKTGQSDLSFLERSAQTEARRQPQCETCEDSIYNQM